MSAYGPRRGRPEVRQLKADFFQLTWPSRSFYKLSPQPVFLNVYDLNPQNDMLFPMGLGAFHSVR